MGSKGTGIALCGTTYVTIPMFKLFADGPIVPISIPLSLTDASFEKSE
jgi:hypothetical protein